MFLSAQLIFIGMVFLGLLGLVYSCVRARRARWILATLNILIPGIVWAGMCLFEFSRPQAWWDWLLDIPPFFLPFVIPGFLAWMLFKDKKTDEYFTKASG